MVCSCARNLGGFRQQAHGRLQGETDHGCSTLEQVSKTLMPATDMRANVEAQTCVDDAPAQEVETNDATDLATWWNGIVKSEGCDTWVAELVNA